MKTLNLVLALAASIGAATANANDCTKQDTLFEGNTGVLCQTPEGQPVCVKWGFHPTVKKNGLRIFSVDQESADRIDRMIFNDPVWHNCKLAVLGGCTDERVKVRESKVTAYRYKSPDVWDARSSETKFALDLTTGSAQIATKGWGPKGDLTHDSSLGLNSCR